MRSLFAFFLLMLCIFNSCEIFNPDTIPVCNINSPKPLLKITSIKGATQCKSPDGEFEVTGEKGKPPYRYLLEGKEVTFSGAFKNLASGEYKVQVLDANNCEGFLKVKLESAQGGLVATTYNTTDNTCFSNNGTITVKTENGMKPLQYRLDDQPFQTDSVFYKLDKGSYKVTVRDASGCQYQFYTTIEHGITGVSYRNDVQPILSRNCNMSGCHNGDAGSTINFTQFSTVRFYGSILIRYASMNHRQPPISQQEIDYIRCWVEDGKPEN